MNNEPLALSTRRTDNRSDFDDDVRYVETHPVDYIVTHPIEIRLIR